MRPNVMGIAIIFLYTFVVLALGIGAGYLDGKRAADRWYAKNSVVLRPTPSVGKCLVVNSKHDLVEGDCAQ